MSHDSFRTESPCRTSVAWVGESKPVSIGELLGNALAGDRDAWAGLVDEFQDLIWWVVRRHRVDEAEAADVVQTVWLQLLRYGHTIENPDRLAAWLTTTARREAWSRQNKRSRERPDEVTLEQADPSQSLPEEQLLDDELKSEALMAFRTLGQPCRQLLQMTIADPPFAYAEIAAIMGRPLGWVGPTKGRCLAKLREKMAQSLSPQSGG